MPVLKYAFTENVGSQVFSPVSCDQILVAMATLKLKQEQTAQKQRENRNWSDIIIMNIRIL